MIIEGIKTLKGNIKVPGDKSISHRAIMLGSLSQGNTVVKNILLSEDTLSTIECFRAMGVKIDIYEDDNIIKIQGNGLYGLKKPNKPLDCGNSGTTMRLMAGLLSAQSFYSQMVGDKSLSKRPMDRVINPLNKMGANLQAIDGKYPPLDIYPVERLNPIEYTLPMASAQVKSAILLASIYTDEKSIVIENKPTRDHTERMLRYFQENNFQGGEIYVPGDISSAGFFMVGASILKNSMIELENVGINPTRTGIIDVLKNMGANISIENQRIINNEPVGDIIVRHSILKGTTIEGNIIGRLIDEIPVLAVAGSFAEGTTIIKDSEELKYKESNRLLAIATELNKMGAKINVLDDGMIIKGVKRLNPTIVESYDDHRIAMALAVASLNIEGTSKIAKSQCVNISYPNFFETICKNIE